MEALEVALRELVQHYVADKIAPGIQLAWLADKELYYSAVHHFPAGLASRTVVAKANEPTAAAAVAKMMEVWRLIVKALAEDKKS